MFGNKSTITITTADHKVELTISGESFYEDTVVEKSDAFEFGEATGTDQGRSFLRI